MLYFCSWAARRIGLVTARKRKMRLNSAHIVILTMLVNSMLGARFEENFKEVLELVKDMLLMLLSAVALAFICMERMMSVDIDYARKAARY